jgi:hypothetical protein
VIGAVQQQQALVLGAQAELNQTLSKLVGSVPKAYKLAELAGEYQKAQTAGRADDAQRLGEQFDTAFREAKGDIFQILSEANGYAYRKAALAKATGERFAGQLEAYRAAPEIYQREQRLAVLEEALKDIRKFVVAADPNDREVVIVDVQEKLTPSLYDIGGLEESSGQ